MTIRVIVPPLSLALLAGCVFAPSADEVDTAQRIQPDIEIILESVRYTVRGTYHAKVRFRNHRDEALWILEPLDGSTDCWHMPHYKFTLSNRAGQMLPLGPRCGNSGLWADTKWPMDYLVKIQPGSSRDIEVSLPFDVREEGPHTLSFEYVYAPKDEAFAPAESAWRGTVKAAPVVVDLKRSEQ